MDELKDFTVSKSETPRNARQLPTLHYIVADDWIDKLGEKAFCLYLKLWTMVDRTGKKHEIKTRQSKLIKRLDMSKSTFLRLIRPLYEYGLIELQEYEGSKNEGSKPVNIVVHRHPQNNPVLAFEQLEKVRDWDKRTEVKYSFTKHGGRPKKEVTPDETPLPENQETDNLEGIDENIVSLLNDNKDKLISKKVDMKVMIDWIKENQGKVSKRDMHLVIEQLASYNEPVKSTGGAIAYVMNNAETIRKAILKADMDKLREERQQNGQQPVQNSVPFYNWLEDQA